MVMSNPSAEGPKRDTNLTIFIFLCFFLLIGVLCSWGARSMKKNVLEEAKLRLSQVISFIERVFTLNLENEGSKERAGTRSEGKNQQREKWSQSLDLNKERTRQNRTQMEERNRAIETVFQKQKRQWDDNEFVLRQKLQNMRERQRDIVHSPDLFRR